MAFMYERTEPSRQRGPVEQGEAEDFEGEEGGTAEAAGEVEWHATAEERARAPGDGRQRATRGLLQDLGSFDCPHPSSVVIVESGRPLELFGRRPASEGSPPSYELLAAAFGAVVVVVVVVDVVVDVVDVVVVDVVDVVVDVVDVVVVGGADGLVVVVVVVLAGV